MECRHWSQTVEVLLTAVVGLAHVLLLIAGPKLNGVGFDGLVCNALPYAQLTLLIAWAALGPGQASVRLSAVPALMLVGVFGWHWLWHTRGTSVNAADYPLLVVTGFLGACLLFGARAIGFQMCRLPAEHVVSDCPAQFSIRSLILLTAFVAAVVGGLE